MKPYSIFTIPERASKALDQLGKENDLNFPLNDGSVLVIGRTDDGEEMCSFPDINTARAAAELANMAFEWGRRYQAAHPNESPDSEYKEIELFSTEINKKAFDFVSNLNKDGGENTSV